MNNPKFEKVKEKEITKFELKIIKENYYLLDLNDHFIVRFGQFCSPREATNYFLF